MERNIPFAVFGNNCNRISNKLESFNKALSDLSPAVFTLQETKRKISDSLMKADNLKKVSSVWTKKGEGKEGRGKRIGRRWHCYWSPTWASTIPHKRRWWCLSVEVKASNHKFLVVTGYGPQLSDTAQRKNSFWDYLEEEFKYAEEKDIGIYIQIDSNSWRGRELIPFDPNKQNGNG